MKLQNYKSNDILAFNLQGLYKVDSVDSMNLGNGPTDYYILSQLTGRFTHKTYVKVDRAGVEGLRPVICSKDFKEAKTKFNTYCVQEMNAKLNCVEKIGVFTKMMISEGFVGSLQAYLSSTLELKKKKEDKKIKEFSIKLRNQIIEEIALSESISIDQARGEFEALIKLKEPLLA